MALKDLWGRLATWATTPEEPYPPAKEPDAPVIPPPPADEPPAVEEPEAPVQVPEPDPTVGDPPGSAPPMEAFQPVSFQPGLSQPGLSQPGHLLPDVTGVPGFTPPQPAPMPQETEFPRAPTPSAPTVPEEPETGTPAPPAGLAVRLLGLGGGAIQVPAPSPAPSPALAPTAPPPAPPAPGPERGPERGPEGEAAPGGFFARLKVGLSRSTARLTGNLTGLFQRRRLDEAALEELEETLIMADLGLPASRRIVGAFRRTRFGKEVSDEEVKGALAEEIAAILAPVAQPMRPDWGKSPYVVLVVGVNGTGKTTTIAKLAQNYRAEGRRVMLAAGDTFRAAAVEQLQIWGERTGSTVVVPAKEGADAAGLAHDALARARAEGAEILLIDTAGRLHNKAGLMEELRKVVRVLRKLDAEVPHAVLLVLDATTGQNAVQQCKVFREMVDVTGLVVTKLDGSAKGGVVVALAEEFGLPVHAVGVGETADDLRPFEARDYARSLVGLS